MPSFTRKQLRNFTTNSANFTAQDYTFTLENNLNTDAGFSIEGKDGKDIMESSSISNLTNCTLVSSSLNVAFLIQSQSTATFTFTPGSGHTLNKDLVLMKAPNVELIEQITTASKFEGVDLDIIP